MNHSRWREKPLGAWASLRASDYRLWVPLLVCGLCLFGALARLAPIAASRFHQDEAVYGQWALQVSTGQDGWLNNFPVDKPPLFIYVLALFLRLFGPTETAARLPSELAAALSLPLLYLLGRRLYGYRTALIALALMACSPFGILFAPTALTDPLMVAWILASLVTSSYQRWGWAGLFLGLGFITKPQAILFLPLVVVAGLCAPQRGSTSCDARSQELETPEPMQPAVSAGSRRPGQGAAGRSALSFAACLALAIVPALIWDSLRLQRVGFFGQSIASYGGLAIAPPITWVDRAEQWRQLLEYVTGSPVLNTVLLVGLPVLLIYGLVRWSAVPSGRLDWILTAFAGSFLCLHVALDLGVWDRYLLGLVPVVALLLSRILILPGNLIRSLWPAARRLWVIYGLAVAVFLTVTVFRPVQDAASSRYPIGGAHGAYNGLDAMVSYIRGHVPGGAVLYHRWLGWHYSFYLFDFPYHFQWYTSPNELAEDAAERPDVPRYVAFPSWHSPTQPRHVLRQRGLDLYPVFDAYRDDGSRSFTLCRIEES